MNLNPINFFKDLNFYAKQEGNKKPLLLLGLFLVVAIANIAFVPGIITVAELLVFLFIFLVLLSSYRDSSRASFQSKAKNLELESVIENIKDGVVVYDTNFRVLDINKAAEEIFNLSKEEVLGVQIQPGMTASPRLRTFTETIFPSLASFINTVSDTGWPKVVDLTFEDPHLEIRTSLNQIADQNGTVVAFLKIVSNNTRENTILESKSEFLTVSAHQLRTPLTAINWTFESLKSSISKEGEKIDPAIINLVDEGWGLAKRSLKIIEDLLSAAKIEEGKFGFNFAETNFMELLKNIKQSAEVVAKEYGITVNLSGNGTYVVRADPERLGMAVTNILDNAIKYNAKGGSVDILVEPEPTDRTLVRCSISDTGIGIPKENLPKIFQKFYRSENAQRVEPNGSGLGMYITKNIIESHGGTIHVESQIGRGTTFWFTLPLVQR